MLKLGFLLVSAAQVVSLTTTLLTLVRNLSDLYTARFLELPMSAERDSACVLKYNVCSLQYLLVVISPLQTCWGSTISLVS